MKSNKTLIAVALVPIVLFSAYVLSGMVDQALYIYPTLETQSAFLKSYTPERVAARFTSSRYSFHEMMGGGASGAGRKFAIHERNFERYFVIQAKDWTPLMRALGEDVSSQLAARGVQILDQTGDPREGFKFRYRSGKTLGAVNVESLKIIDPETAIGHLTSGRPNTICPGEVAVELRVSVQEKYFKKEPDPITAKLTAGPK